MRELSWMSRNTRKDKMRNEFMHSKVEVAPIQDGLVMSNGDRLMHWCEKVI